jgi:hypothetical protein
MGGIFIVNLAFYLLMEKLILISVPFYKLVRMLPYGCTTTYCPYGISIGDITDVVPPPPLFFFSIFLFFPIFFTLLFNNFKRRFQKVKKFWFLHIRGWGEKKPLLHSLKHRFSYARLNWRCEYGKLKCIRLIFSKLY